VSIEDDETWAERQIATAKSWLGIKD
jgi:hypothetical protein